MVTWVAEPHSFLGWAACVRPGCTGRALTTIERAPTARCGSCMAQDHPPAGPVVRQSAPVVAHTVPNPGAPEHRRDVSTSITPPFAPEHVSRDPFPEGWEHPRPVLSLAEHARAAGWSVRVQYARGWGMHARTGAPTQLMHTVAVRVGTADPFAGGHAGYALYRTPVARKAWTWESLWVWGSTMPPRSLGTLGAFTAWLDSPDGMSDMAMNRDDVS